MGFMDKIKKATGVGLNHQEHYARVYEKAILLGPEHFGKAVDLFNKAAEAASKAGDDDLEARALANATLYAFVTSKSLEHLPTLADRLGKLGEIEQVGSQSDTMPTASIVEEIAARLVERRLNGVSEKNSAALAEAHRQAAGSFRKLGGQELFTYKYVAPDQHTQSASSRALFHYGQASWHDAVGLVTSDPEGAAEHMAKALNFFRQCNDESWAGRADTWLRKCRQKRTCWICGREFQGADLHFKSYPTDLVPYTRKVVEALGQDLSTLDFERDELVLCRPCGATVEKLADSFAIQRTNELRTEVGEALSAIRSNLNEIAGAVGALNERLRAVERVAHRH